MKYRILLLTILITSSILAAVATPQVLANPDPGWAKAYGTVGREQALVVHQTSDGGYVFGGRGGSPAWVTKLDASGTIQWQKTYGGRIGDGSTSLQVLPDGGYVFVGQAPGGGDGWVVRLDSTGSIVWQKTYGGPADDNFRAVVRTSDGGFLVGGYTANWGTGMWIVKLDAQGTVQWSRTATTSQGREVQAWSVAETTGGGYVAAGYADVGTVGRFNPDMFVVKLDAQGNLLWSRLVGVNDREQARTVVPTSDGGILVGGFLITGNKALLVKFSSAGAVEWQKTYSVGKAYAYFILQSLAKTSDGGFVATGWLRVQVKAPNFAITHDLFVLRLDGNGNVLWMRTYGNPENNTQGELGWGIEQTSDGGFVVGGETGAYAQGGQDAWILKLDSDGTVASSCSSSIGASKSVSTSNSNLAVSTPSVTPAVATVTTSDASETPVDYTATTATQCSTP